MFVVAHSEVLSPSLDPILPPFFPSDHNLRYSPSQLVTSHFQDIDPSQSNLPHLDLISLGVTQPIATILASVQHVSQLIPTFDSYSTAATNLIILTRIYTLLSHLLSLPPIKPIYIIDYGSPCPLATLNPFGRELLLLDVFIGIK
jgi:hypothetical protein